MTASNITFQFAEYTVYTHFAIPTSRSNTMTENKTPTKSATKPVAKKPAAVRAPAKAKTAVAKPEKKKKVEGKVKVVRDSFTMPRTDYDMIAELKQKALNSGLHVKKSELLRAGLHLLGKQSVAQLKQTLAGLEKIKTGRPQKS